MIPATEKMTLDTSSAVSELQATLNGRLITPEDERYDKARTIFYAGFDRRPAAIVRAADAGDVSRVVSLARETGLELAVRSGGHSLAGHGLSDGGIVLDLSAMKGLEIDVEERTAWAETGLTAGEYTAATAEHGLATGFGDSGAVGIGGITLGGGVGFLSRKHGLTIDSLLAADVVTADGQLRRVDAENHPDLFWAIRGGGGNFGVATRFQFRLHEVGEILGGIFILPARPEIIASFVAEAQAAPEELTIIANVMVAPPLPFVPQEHHGKLILFALICYAGDLEVGHEVMAPFRAITTPLTDMVRPMRYPELFLPEEEDFHPRFAGRTFFLDEFDHRTAETIIERLQASTAPMSATQLRVLGGAVARVPTGATAYAHRQQRIMVNVVAAYENPEEAATHEAWVAQSAAVLRDDQNGAYVNFLGDEGAARVRDAYPGSTWQRLVAVKSRYDPANLFRLNHNVPPAADRSES